MGLSSYSDLKSSVATRLGRSGDTTLDSELDDYIDLAEARFGRELRVRAQETRATATVSAEYLDLPSDFLECRNIQLNATTTRALDFMTMEQIDRNFEGSDPAEPQAYSIVGTQFQFAPSPDQDYTVEIDYWAAFGALSTTTTTNWLLTNAPDVYLFGVLAEAAQATGNSALWQEYEARYGAALERLKASDRKSRYSGSVMRVRPRPQNVV